MQISRVSSLGIWTDSKTLPFIIPCDAQRRRSAAHLRQTILMTAYETPETRSIFNSLKRESQHFYRIVSDENQVLGLPSYSLFLLDGHTQSKRAGEYNIASIEFCEELHTLPCHLDPNPETVVHIAFEHFDMVSRVDSRIGRGQFVGSPRRQAILG